MLRLEHLVLDVNGTLTERGRPIEGAVEALGTVAVRLELHVVSADTFGGAEQLAETLGARFRRVGTGRDKRAYVEQLGGEQCVAVGNGANDAAMLEAAALGIAVVGPEGAAGTALQAADVVCGSIVDALGLLLDERALVATLRP